MLAQPAGTSQVVIRWKLPKGGQACLRWVARGTVLGRSQLVHCACNLKLLQHFTWQTVDLFLETTGLMKSRQVSATKGAGRKTSLHSLTQGHTAGRSALVCWRKGCNGAVRASRSEQIGIYSFLSLQCLTNTVQVVRSGAWTPSWHDEHYVLPP